MKQDIKENTINTNNNDVNSCEKSSGITLCKLHLSLYPILRNEMFQIG
jgi:hypothetical protein